MIGKLLLGKMLCTATIFLVTSRRFRLSPIAPVYQLQTLSVLTTTLDPSRPKTNQSIIAFRHSSFGLGQRIDLAASSHFFWQTNKKSGGAKKKAGKSRINNVYNIDVSPAVSLFLLFV
jgi:hypothetical protein